MQVVVFFNTVGSSSIKARNFIFKDMGLPGYQGKRFLRFLKEFILQYCNYYARKDGYSGDYSDVSAVYLRNQLVRFNVYDDEGEFHYAELSSNKFDMDNYASMFFKKGFEGCFDKLINSLEPEVIYHKDGNSQIEMAGIRARLMCER